jgi:hypothetical protein
MEKIKDQSELERFFGMVLRPIDFTDLQVMLEAANLIVTFEETKSLNTDEIRMLIDRMDDRDDRNMFRRRLIIALVKAGQWHDALNFANQTEQLVEKLDILLLLATKHLEAGNQKEGLIILEEVEQTAYTSDSKDIWLWQRIMALDEAANKLLQADIEQKSLEVWQRAIEISRLGPIGEDENIAIQNMVGHLAETGKFDLAREAAELISHPGRKKVALGFMEKPGGPG